MEDDTVDEKKGISDVEETTKKAISKILQTIEWAKNNHLGQKVILVGSQQKGATLALNAYLKGYADILISINLKYSDEMVCERTLPGQVLLINSMSDMEKVIIDCDDALELHTIYKNRIAEALKHTGSCVTSLICNLQEEVESSEPHFEIGTTNIIHISSSEKELVTLMYEQTFLNSVIRV